MKSEETFIGYKGTTLKWMKNQSLKVWDEIEIIKEGTSLKGVILPRSELADPNFISLKLPTGYNIGFDPIKTKKIKKIGHFEAKYRIPKTEISQKPNLPLIPILGCGGTIASRLDYQTGGTIPALSPEELFSSFPEIADLARVETHLLFEIFSENLNFDHYERILKAIDDIIKTRSPQGIVLTHGTDTMAFTASALTFAINNPPIPIVITGSQRSSDRPSSDAFFNLYNSVLYAASPRARKQVVIIMHEESSDTSCTIHTGTRVRKMHSSRRDTFKTIGESPLGRIINGKIQYSRKDKVIESKDSHYHVSTKFERMVGLINHYPGIQSDVIDFYVNAGYKGLVLAGTGLGHFSSNLIPVIRKAVNNGLIVVMTTQCLQGFTGLSVYENGRQLQKAGVIPLSNILPEIAYIKLAYLLGNYRESEKIKELMKMNLKGEIKSRERFCEF
ncbi:MAG: Glu-tRNA(Gln) amidotransferase subunit GatD [Candidatus Heimdallarchaeota archaeon]|nr:MAG: Glu-tRNA(Gln) amidotransferase subunit GatD [Candidatus Heimdallarchaeota archaeon]